MSRALAPPPRPFADAIRVVRGRRVMIDRDLAAFYGVSTAALNQAVRRNDARFPPDFAFRLTPVEAAHLRSQIVIASWGGRRSAPLAFTEHGVAMLSSVLRSRRAIAVNIRIMRAFVETRALVASHAVLVRRLDALERKYDGRFDTVFGAIRRLMLPARPPRRRIGFGG